jgi:hypothetical protein
MRASLEIAASEVRRGGLTGRFFVSLIFSLLLSFVATKESKVYSHHQIIFPQKTSLAI